MLFTTDKISRQLPEIKNAIYREVIDIPVLKFHEGPCDGAHRIDFDDSNWSDFQVGSTWGGYDVTAWFRARVAIPAHLQGKKLSLRLLVGPRDGGGSTAETLLFVNGSPLQGIDVWHEEAWLPPELLKSGEIQVALKSWSGVLDVPAFRRFKLAQLAWIDEPSEKFYHLCNTLSKSIAVMPENDLRRVRLLESLNGAFLKVDFLEPKSEEFYRSIEEALQGLQSQLQALESIEELKPIVVGIGHAHIDMAWLWRLGHSREKASRTFSTALHLIRQYPEYRFMHSSPQLYKFLKQDYPEIYTRVKEKIASGEWEITGGMWVEADTNLTSGESLIRQILYGRRFVREEFGVEMNVLWLPDVFGYSWALPQIVKKSGMKYFLTSKISWSQYNRFPHDTFLWRGIDGTELLTHFVTTPENGSRIYTYNGQITPSEAKGIWDNYRQKDINDQLLMLFGWGDGGGGPTKEMLESARALKNLPGMPKVEMGKAEPFFEQLEQRLEGKNLPVWDGELYLEYHRGTYTSQAQIKRANRSAEVLYHNAEWLSSAADLLMEQKNYPAEALHNAWEKILLNQFHDILPGSSIQQVYEDSRKDYAEIQSVGQQAVEAAKDRIFERIPVEQQSAVVLNPLSWKRSGVISLPWTEELEDKSIVDNHGCKGPVQVVEQDGEKAILMEVQDVPSMGYNTYSLVEREVSESLEVAVPAAAGAQDQAVLWEERPTAVNLPLKKMGRNGGNGKNPVDTLRYTVPLVPQRSDHGESANELTVTPDHLENRYFRIELNNFGQITSIWDKRSSREVIAEGKAANVLQAFEDKPMDFDAWDIDIYYQEKMRVLDHLVEAVVEETGPVRGVLRLRWRFADSEILQRMTIYRTSPRIDFRTEVDWRQKQVLLKVAFPVTIRSTRATYDIQMGTIERPTHWNTSWDYARFETVGHKWVDLSEGNYGVALLNDCKYGYDVKDNVVRLTLIKSAKWPDATADQGKHIFTYSLLPHLGDWREGKVVEEGYDLNNPLIAGLTSEKQGGDLPSSYCLASLSADHVILETVKQAEDADGSWIFRVYECQQCRNSNVRIQFGHNVEKAVECNLVEEGEEPVFYTEDGINFSIQPYEIKTFKVWFSQ